MISQEPTLSQCYQAVTAVCLYQCSQRAWHGDPARGRLSMRAPPCGPLDEDNLTQFQNDAMERESVYNRKTRMVFVSTPGERPVRCAPHVFAIPRKRHCVQLATGSQFVSGIITHRCVFIKCERVYGSPSKKRCLC